MNQYVNISALLCQVDVVYQAKLFASSLQLALSNYLPCNTSYEKLHRIQVAGVLM